MIHLVFEAAIKVMLVIGGLMTAAAYLVLVERRVAAWVQDRRGPNRVGIPLTKIRLWGLGQPLADGVKFVLKEEYTPAHVDKGLFALAPISILAAALTVFAVVPFGSWLPVSIGGKDLTTPLVVAPGLDVGIIFVFALSSVAVYGVILGGWASNSKYSFLGALRSSAQLIAYELPLGLGLLGVVIATGTLNLEKVIESQATSGIWFLFTQPLGFVVFVVAAFAEAARLPFDLPEAEQELVGGYHTEYSGMKLLLFLVAEFLHMILASFLIVILFLGGWHFWGITGSDSDIGIVTAILRVLVLMTKVFLVILFFMIVRWSWPRFRYDQLMNLAWKVMLPLGLVNFVAVMCLQQMGFVWGQTPTMQIITVALSWVVCVVAWLATAVAGPLIADNRPRREMEVQA